MKKDETVLSCFCRSTRLDGIMRLRHLIEPIEIGQSVIHEEDCELTARLEEILAILRTFQTFLTRRPFFNFER